MKRSTDLLKISLSCALLIGSIGWTMAQPANPTSPTPFGFVELLIGAGALYGGKKVYDKWKKKEQKNKP